MSPICALLASVLTALCAPAPPPVLDGLHPAVALRPEVERAAATANALLEAAGETPKVVPEWNLDGTPGEDEVVVYLMGSPASPSSQAAQRKRATELVETMQTNLPEIDQRFYDCSDSDDCVEGLYPEETGTLAVNAVNQLNSWDVGKTDPDCRCVLLNENDLRIFAIVFGAAWDRYFLLNRFDSAEEFQQALDQGRIPEMILDGRAMTLEAMLVLILLHEVGHVSPHDFGPPPDGDGGTIATYRASLDASEREEARADDFLAGVLNRACIGRPLAQDQYDACLAPPELGLLTFVIGMKGKSRVARCLRYFDTVKGYPNWQARFLTISAALNPGFSDMLGDYLGTRAELAKEPWARTTPGCAREARQVTP